MAVRGAGGKEETGLSGAVCGHVTHTQHLGHGLTCSECPGLWNDLLGSLAPRCSPRQSPAFPLQRFHSKSWSHLPLKISKVSFPIILNSLIYSHEYLSPMRVKVLGSGRHQTGPGDPRTTAQPKVGRAMGPRAERGLLPRPPASLHLWHQSSSSQQPS